MKELPQKIFPMKLNFDSVCLTTPSLKPAPQTTEVLPHRQPDIKILTNLLLFCNLVIFFADVPGSFFHSEITIENNQFEGLKVRISHSS